MNGFDAEMEAEQLVSPDHISNGNVREGGTVWRTGRRVDTSRSGRAVARAEDIGTHDEIVVGIKERVIANESGPPGYRVGVRRECVANPHHVIFFWIICTERMIRDIE